MSGNIYATATLLKTTAFAYTSRQLQRQRPVINAIRLSCSKVRPVRTLGSNHRVSVCSRPHLKKHELGTRYTTTESTSAVSPELAGLPSYTPPTNGILSTLPQRWIPYAELIRIDKPAGTNYLFLPCVFGTLLAAPLASPIASPPTVVSTIALFYAAAIIMRGAGCTINDLWDRNLDSQVARTRLRPIARGAITVPQAMAFLAAQLAAGLAVLLQFPPQCFFYATPSLILVALYPLAKRVTYYPQFVLGLTFSWGAIVGFPALGIDLLSNTPALVSAACLYSSCVAWTLIYDMIYAHQDIRDDVKAGIKSIALAHENNAKAVMNAIAAVQVSLLAGAGFAIGASPVFYLAVCGGAASTLTHMIQVVDLSNVKDCWAWFKRGALLTGGVISAGLGLEYLIQYFGWSNAARVKHEEVPS